ncbi:hypothetical protein [Nocardia salmonicida]|uniref:hypothetical protein n=1 Tax=Nocardia salmonicida TaxID=53431 RepID=UPI000AC4B6F3|nr:hypothetical protein [Nocardia salmonicida]MBC7299518.1 hypothetical protein [Nocardia sp.]
MRDPQTQESGAVAPLRVWWRWWRPVDAGPAVIVFAEEPAGIRWEVKIRQLYTASRAGSGTDLYVADEGYRAFSEFPGLFAALASQRPATLDAVLELLVRLGVEEEVTQPDSSDQYDGRALVGSTAMLTDAEGWPCVNTQLRGDGVTDTLTIEMETVSRVRNGPMRVVLDGNVLCERHASPLGGG